MSNNLNIVNLILAAGESKRMGTPKQLLRWKKTTLLGQAIQTSKELNLKSFVVLGANFEAIKTSIKHYDSHTIYNENWKNGLGSSIALGVDYIKKNYSVDGILITLADQPLIDVNYLETLINSFDNGNKQIVASNYSSNNSEKKLGVPALFDSFYFDELSELTSDIGAKKVLLNHLENVLGLNAKHLISDIDTKEDYELFYKANH